MAKWRHSDFPSNWTYTPTTAMLLVPFSMKTNKFNFNLLSIITLYNLLSISNFSRLIDANERELDEEQSTFHGVKKNWESIREWGKIKIINDIIQLYMYIIYGCFIIIMIFSIIIEYDNEVWCQFQSKIIKPQRTNIREYLNFEIF